LFWKCWCGLTFTYSLTWLFLVCCWR